MLLSNRTKPRYKYWKVFVARGLVFLMVTFWFFSGWPQIWNFPPKIQLAHATTVVLTPGSANPWPIPSDWNDTNTIHVIGGGGGGGGGGTGGGQDPGAGGGGGAYSVLTDLDLNFGDADVAYTVGAGGGGGSGASNGTDGADSIFNGSGSTCAAQPVCAEHGGGGGAAGGAAGAGGLEINGISEAAGRDGGAGEAAPASIGGGGGGAGGDTANGAVGGGVTSGTGGVGGGSGAAGGGASGNPGGTGTAGTEWTTAGSGGGGGGGDKGNGGPGGTSGAGGGGADNGKIGGAGIDGVIVIIYTPVATATLTQNDFEFWYDDDTADPNDVIGTPDLAENAVLDAIPVNNEAPTSTVEIRIRMNITVSGATVSADDHSLKLQYATSTLSSLACQSESAGIFQDVEANSSTAAWRFAASSVTDDAAIARSILSSDVDGFYAKSNTSHGNPATSSDPQDYEVDWHLQNNASGAITYCFRMVTTTADLDGYTADSYPRITTPPGTENVLRHGNFFDQVGEKGFFWAD